MTMRNCVFILLAAVFLQACATKTLVKTSDYGKLFSPAMDREMHYSVYTPPDWNAQESLPLVVLLHGAWDDHQSFDRYEVGQYLDAQFISGQLPRVILVNPNGDRGFWENWHDGTRHYRDWVVKDLMPVVQARYNTQACPQNCFVTGISMGAHGALRFAHHEADTFSSTAAISGVIFSKSNKRPSSWKDMLIRLIFPIERIWGDIKAERVGEPIDPYVTWLHRDGLKDMDLFLAWGSDDSESIIASNERFHSHLLSNNREHTWLIFDGEHKWVDWREMIAESIRFHVKDATLNGAKVAQQ